MAGLERVESGSLLFEARPTGALLNQENDLGAFEGPAVGEYDKGGASIEVKWYTFGRVDVGVDPAEESYYIIRVRPPE